jgi:hypothetical protein
MKREKLLELMIKIHLESFKMGIDFKTAWFFLEFKGIKGYLGTDKIIFAGINPSYGRFPNKPVMFFYECLKKYGFENAHLTDIIKSRLTRQQSNQIKRNTKILKINLNWLKQELKIIDKDIKVKIVGLGRDPHKILKENFPKQLISAFLHHYSWVESYSEAKRKEKRKKFEEEMKNIKKKLLI